MRSSLPHRVSSTSAMRNQWQTTFARIRPDLVINAAAYTAVDKAESERESAFATNADGAGNVARACSPRATPLIHLSTDYVFDGTTHFGLSRRRSEQTRSTSTVNRNWQASARSMMRGYPA